MYEIYFPELGITQYKLLIPHSDWKEAYMLSDKKWDARIKYLTKGKEWFTEQSPYYKAISTEVYDCNNYRCKCIVKQLN